MLSPKSALKSEKINYFEKTKKTPRGTDPQKYCTSFEAYWSIFRHGSDVIFALQTRRQTRCQRTFRCSERLKSSQKKLQLNRRNSDIDFGYEYTYLRKL